MRRAASRSGVGGRGVQGGGPRIAVFQTARADYSLGGLVGQASPLTGVGSTAHAGSIRATTSASSGGESHSTSLV